MKKITVAVVYCSRYGHTKAVADAFVKGASKLAKVNLYTTVEAASKLDELDRADAIVFGAPTYMGNMASEMKLFLESTVSRWLSRAWADKIAGGFTNSGNFCGDKLNTLQGILTSCMQLGMIWVSLNILPGEGSPDAEKSVNGPGALELNRNGASLGPMAASFNVRVPEAPPAGDLLTAERYGERIATVTARFVNGAH